MKITKELVTTIHGLLDAGLPAGLGTPVPGKMCVEAAICYALGEPHGDSPSCVGYAVRGFKIRLNDAKWPSNKSRAEGMRRLAIAQLGSDKIDQSEFVKRIVLCTIQVILPMIVRHKKMSESLALSCEQASTLEEAKIAAIAVRKDTYADAASDAAAYAAAASADAASNAADAAASYAAYAAAYAAYAASYAAAASAAYAAAASDAAAYAAAASADAADAAVELYLKTGAELAVQVLVEMNCEGTKWL